MSSPDRSEPADWRPLVAALANADTRRVFAQVELGRPLDEIGAGLSPSRRRRALDAATRAGLITIQDGAASVAAERFTRALRDAPARPPRTGVDRFLDAEGRIDRYPSSAADRAELLRHVAGTVLAPGEVVDEAELGERLQRFGDDTAALRRHLVDSGLVGRTVSGSSYSRTDTE
ncbi:DUF2087 domain-containing protein [Leifsonia sp. 71-9]|uniref:DUF2087 domain-containing protein n=1 Tax=Leifsonia sp. 71-9 TaxID=1895934 RepID=UPI000929C009|nr:DUF2087 domain-containing protein [Leifsonia sp. 71-9]OJX75524.1 MAG: hypothetical protein BGO91_19810 [Leifsonia sp. 71-9]